MLPNCLEMLAKFEMVFRASVRSSGAFIGVVCSCCFLYCPRLLWLSIRTFCWCRPFDSFQVPSIFSVSSSLPVTVPQPTACQMLSLLWFQPLPIIGPGPITCLLVSSLQALSCLPSLFRLPGLTRPNRHLPAPVLPT